jgi:hypothetical protein
VSLVITELDSPTDEPRNCPSAGSKSPEDNPCRYAHRQHLVDLRGLAAPRRQNRGGEPCPLAGVGIDSLVVDPWDGHLDRAGRGQDLAGFVVAVAHHQPPARLVTLLGEPGDALLHLAAQRLGEHPPRTFTHDVIDHRRGLAQRHTAGAGVIVSSRLGDYGEHGSYLPDRR